MSEVTEKMVEAALYAFGYYLPQVREIDLLSMIRAIEAALAAQTPVSIRCPECAKANAERDKRFVRKP